MAHDAQYTAGQSAFREWWKANVECDGPDREDKSREFLMAPRFTCADGFSVSVQASRTHYCTPRISDRSGEYSAWEVGFPTQADDLLQQYAEDDRDLTESVYGYVPTEVIDALIKKHGGIVSPRATQPQP